jgi:hypothetical protein
VSCRTATRESFVEWIEKNNKIDGMGWWITVVRNGTIADHADGGVRR